MQVITRSFNRALHLHWWGNHSDFKRHMKRHAHHRVRMETRAAIALGNWDRAETPIPTRLVTSWDV
jgi:hypothetical protein